jgi:hypothetical protein
MERQQKEITGKVESWKVEADLMEAKKTMISKELEVLKAEKAKGRGMGLQDEELPPGKMVAAKKGKMIKKAKDMSKLHENRETTMQEGKETMMESKGYKESSSGKMVKKMGGGMVDPTMANYQKGGSVMARGSKLAKVRPTKLY